MFRLSSNISLKNELSRRASFEQRSGPEHHSFSLPHPLEARCGQDNLDSLHVHAPYTECEGNKSNCASAWSNDGRQLAFTRETSTNDLVLIQNFR